jgi:addiction module HigA family antidote
MVTFIACGTTTQVLTSTQRKLAELIDVSPRRINQIIKGERAITPDTSFRLGKLFGQSDTFWLNLQQHYEVELARETSDLTRVQVWKDVG